MLSFDQVGQDRGLWLELRTLKHATSMRRPPAATTITSPWDSFLHHTVADGIVVTAIVASWLIRS